MPGIRAKVLEIKANLYRNHRKCAIKFWSINQGEYVYDLGKYA